MSFFCKLTRRHYWSIPHRTADNQLVKVCYECGAERPAQMIHNEVAAEWLKHAVAAAKDEMPNLRAQLLRAQTAGSELAVKAAAGGGHAAKLVVVK